MLIAIALSAALFWLVISAIAVRNMRRARRSFREAEQLRDELRLIACAHLDGDMWRWPRTHDREGTR